MVKHFTQFAKVLGSCALVAFFTAPEADAQISINPFTTSYSQNFNSLPSSGSGTWAHGTEYFPGWYLAKTATATTTLLTGTGTNNTGGVYSFGAAGSTDRALGSIASATSTAGEYAWGLLIQNNSGKTITTLHINYTGEQWRSARPATPQHLLSFWYAVSPDKTTFNLSPKTDAGWTNVKDLDFYGPVYYATGSALDGNAPANKKFLSASIPVNIPDKSYVMLRWKDLDEFESDHGLAIDDFSMTWSFEAVSGPTILPVELVNFTATQKHNAVQLNWATASEKDNKQFIVERSQNGKEFTSIATVNGKGTSTIHSNYSFTDAEPPAGVSYYRLKQVDLDGTFVYSKTVTIKVQQLQKAILYPTITSDNLYLDVAEPNQSVSVYDVTGKQVYQDMISNNRNHSLNVGHFKAGNYSLLLFNSKGEKQVLRFIKR